MSSKSKTGDKLVASIQKSKSGTAVRKTSQRPDADESDTKSKATAARSAPKAAANKPAITTTNQGRKDMYSFGRRVWPD